MKNQTSFRRITALLMIICLALAALPAYASAPVATEVQAPEASPSVDEARATKDHSAVLNIGMDAFERYDALLKDANVVVKNPYEREKIELGWENIFYEPIDGLFVKAGVWSSNEEGPPHYIIAGKTNKSFENTEELWQLMEIFLRAINPDMTRLAAYDLMSELLYGRSSPSEGILLSICHYGPWRITFTSLPESGDDSDGPTLFITPEEKPIQEPVNGSLQRLMNQRERFTALAKEDGFALREDAEIEYVEPDQYVWEYLEQAWWMEMFSGNMYLGNGFNIAKESPHFDKAADLYVDLLIASFPYLEPSEAREIYEDLNKLYIAEGPSNGNQAGFNFGDYVLVMMEQDEQKAILVINPFDSSATAE